MRATVVHKPLGFYRATATGYLGYVGEKLNPYGDAWARTIATRHAWARSPERAAQRAVAKAAEAERLSAEWAAKRRERTTYVDVPR